ncbi:glycosyltransferase family 2 protein [Paenibacillus ginsengarvi]|uniref:cellulose synthase (UDP-forming) n=1 Tax=Paenibacillus ginsengarvi TaxID=400777 RepID=A0A3B0CMG5_9BACL|nr:glycosyltransferase [Paenibacillus ginsengarvi]RKN85948.1 glycosyltransferase [Paenibacillus ginsengarvi]
MQNQTRQNILFVVTMILMSIYLLWRMLFTLPWDEGVLNILFGFLLIMAETITVLTTFELFLQKMQKERTQLDFPTIPPDYYPHVDVFIATHNEPVDLLYKTVNACTFMDYPDKSKVHIYLCDDGARPAVEELARQFGVGYLGFPGNKDAKSGNLNNALSKSSSPLLATFDADMIPQHTFLMKTVPYFLLSEFIEDNGQWRLRSEEERDDTFKLGLVQTPQSFYNPDLFQFNLYAEQGIPNEQDFFSREVNILRNASNAVAYTGSNTVISRKAMEEIGGFPLKTITEDFETSIRLQQAGYITYATQEVQAAGLTTTTIQSMIKQRIRWARGIIQSLQNTRAVFSKKLAIWGRITYLSSFLYWWSFFNRLIFLMSPILFALFDFKIVNTTFVEILIFWLPSYFCYSMSMRYLSSNIRNQRWSQIIDTIFMPYLIVPVLLETFGIHERKFKVTNKNKGVTQKWVSSLMYALPHIFLIMLSIAALVKYTYGKYGLALLYSSIIVFWLVHNMIALCYALFFMVGRRAYRETERIRAKEQVTIHYKTNNLQYEAQTIDVSEHGIALYVSRPIYLPPHTAISLTVKSRRYEANLEAEIVYVAQDGEGWRYSATVQPIDEANKRQYMQIIYDRKHSLPEQLNLWDTAYDDMVRNVKRRIIQPVSFQRQTPRIPLQCPVVFTNGDSCTLRSFNFLFFSASSFDFKGDTTTGNLVTFYTKSNIEVILQHQRKTRSRRQELLLAVVNINELVERGLIDQMLEDLIHSQTESA